VNGQWGIYQVIRCYKSITKYFADLKLIEPATTEQEAVMKFMAIQQKKAREGKLKVVIY